MRGYGANPYIKEVTKPLIVDTGLVVVPNPKLAITSQVYHEYRRGTKARYARGFETFGNLEHSISIL